MFALWENVTKLLPNCGHGFFFLFLGAWYVLNVVVLWNVDKNGR